MYDVIHINIGKSRANWVYVYNVHIYITKVKTLKSKRK